MHEDIVVISPITVIGLAVETNNQREATKEGLIVPLSHQFQERGLAKALDDCLVDDRVITVYTDYHQGESGDYTYAIGHQVRDPQEMPDDCQIFDIPGGHYLRFPTERGILGDVLPAAWQTIWRKTQEGSLGVERNFLFDFEFHNYDADQMHDAQVDIYLGVVASG